MTMREVNLIVLTALTVDGVKYELVAQAVDQASLDQASVVEQYVKVRVTKAEA